MGERLERRGGDTEGEWKYEGRGECKVKYMERNCAVDVGVG